MLSAIEAAELLSLVNTDKGDVILGPLGETYAEASILARKEIFASRIRRLPMFRWLLAMLRSADKQKLRLEVIETALELEFPPEDAGQQIETLVNWGRYAEILAYDDDSEMLYLEPAVTGSRSSMGL